MRNKPKLFRFILSTTIISWLRRLSLSVLTVGCLTSSSAVQAQEAEIVKVDVNEDQVTLRIQVREEENRPVSNLSSENFRVFVEEQEVDKYDWNNSQETVPPDAWIIFLLDMSGSMKNPDGGDPDITKLEGAIKGIREFSEATANRGVNTQVAIVPFGESGGSCKGFTVNENRLDIFFPAGDVKLQNYLDYLESQTPCASTNLYQPLNSAVKFLADKNDPRFYAPENSGKPQPRILIILISDGYHSAGKEDAYFNKLEELLKNNNYITVHSLGYGLTPAQLGAKYRLSRAATREDIFDGPIENLPPGKVPAHEFVDVKTLDKIARLTQGFTNISNDAQEVAKTLKEFLNALLGEYEITYTDPKPERGAIHDVYVVVESRHLPNPVISNPKSYRMPIFLFSLPFLTRIVILLAVLTAMAVGDALPLWFWVQALKRKI